MFYRTLLDKFKDWVIITGSGDLVYDAWQTGDMSDFTEIYEDFEDYLDAHIKEDVIVDLVCDYCETSPVCEYKRTDQAIS